MLPKSGQKKAEYTVVTVTTVKESAEHEGYDRVLTEKRITENNITDVDSREYTLCECVIILWEHYKVRR